MAQDPFSTPEALEAHFRRRGFVDQRGIADAATRQVYSKVLVPGGEPDFLLSAHILSGENVGELQVGHQAIFDETQRADVSATLVRMLGDLFEAAELGDPTELLVEALERREEREKDFGAIRLQVLFPEREPDQDFEVIYVEASRPLEPGEWQELSGTGPLVAAVTAGEANAAAAEAACREILEARGHRFAAGPFKLRMSSAMGEDRLDVLRGPEGASLWLTTSPSGERRLGIVRDDGTREDF